MSDINNFLDKNIPLEEEDKIFNSCLEIIVYSYQLMVKEPRKFSRSEIVQIAREVKKRQVKRLELEDYLRNILVEEYIEPNQTKFGLENVIFQAGADENSRGIKTGILDIKVKSPLLNGKTYYVFECKRLNKVIIDKYVTEGVIRFSSKQYYPDIPVTKAGMISFLESVKASDQLLVIDSLKELVNTIEKHKGNCNLAKNLISHKITSKDADVDGFQYVFTSVHNRENVNPIMLYHIVLDYNDLVNV